MEKIDISINDEVTFKVDPTRIQEHVILLKAQIKRLEEEFKGYESMMLSMLKANGGKISCDLGDVYGEVTLCKKNKYKYSQEVTELEKQAKYLDTTIKSKKLIEIAAGAEIKSCDESLRYNIKIKMED